MGTVLDDLAEKREHNQGDSSYTSAAAFVPLTDQLASHQYLTTTEEAEIDKFNAWRPPELSSLEATLLPSKEHLAKGAKRRTQTEAQRETSKEVRGAKGGSSVAPESDTGTGLLQQYTTQSGEAGILIDDTASITDMDTSHQNHYVEQWEFVKAQFKHRHY